MYEFLTVLGSGLALFLVGANLSFMANLGSRLARWFAFKIMAITLLLGYVSLSMWVGNPDGWRLVIGFTALCMDIGALVWMWASIERAAKTGTQGFVPLFRGDDQESRRSKRA